jgi:hypothetical protein
MSCVRTCLGGVELDVWVAPRASRPGLGPLHGERLRAAVSAPPVDGAANEAVVKLVAESLGVARSDVGIVRGATGRNKTLRIAGDTPSLLLRLEAFGASALPPKNTADAVGTAPRKR